MNNIPKKLLPLFLILLLVLSGCGGSNSSTQTATETGGNSWLVAEAQPVTPPAANPRTSGSSDWRDEIIYFIMTDRFSDGDSSNNQPFYNKGNINYYHGGDLQGIEERVNYIRSLGATAIWITPVVDNVWRSPHYPDYTGYHGYWAHDFTKLDSHLGSGNSFYQSFINDMHQNGILVIQDIVTNHMGPVAAYANGWTPPYSLTGYTRKFAQDLNPGSAEEYNYTIPSESPFNNLSAFHKYGQISNYDDATQVTDGDLSDLPDLNTENAEVQNELINAYKNWVSYGVDGFRIDTYKHVNMGFWNNFCPAIRNQAGGKNFFQFSEVWIGYHPTLANYLNGQTGADSVLNYDLYYVMLGVFANDGQHSSATNMLTQELERRNSYTNVSAQEKLVNFIDNHDNNRFLTSDGGNLDRLWLALTYLMTTKGIPCIYYNTENNVNGDTNTGRQDMPDFETTNKKTFTLIRVLSKIRKDNIALRRGDIEVLKDSTCTGIFAFVRYDGVPKDNVYVLLNTSGQAINETVNVSGYASDGTTITNILYAEFGKADLVTVNNGSITVNIPAYSMKIFKK